MKIVLRKKGKLQAGSGIKLRNAQGNRLIKSTATSTGGTSYTEGAASDVVGTDGKLLKAVRHSTYATPSAYPTVVKMVNGTKSITLDSTGITMTDSSTGKSFTIAFSALTQNVALRTDAYCDAGTDKTQMHVGSAPY